MQVLVIGDPNPDLLAKLKQEHPDAEVVSPEEFAKTHKFENRRDDIVIPNVKTLEFFVSGESKRARRRREERQNRKKR